MNTTNRVIKNTGFLYAKMGITMFISLYTTRLILNALGISDFGIFNIVGGAIAMLGFLNVAMDSASQRFMSYTEGEGNKEKQKKIFNVSFILHFGISIVVGIGLLIAGWFFFNGILNIAPERFFAAKVVYASLIISTIFTIMTVPYDAVLNAHENMLYYSIVGVIESVMKLLVAIIIVHATGDKLILYGILMAVIPLITMTIMRIYCHKKYEECIIAPKLYWDKNLMKEMTSFAGWNLVGSSSSMIGGYGSGIVLNHFFGTVVNAANGITGQMNGQLLAFSNTMQKALSPMITKTEGRGERALMIESAVLGSKYSFLMYAFFAVPLFIETPFILKLWLKNVPDWTLIFIRISIFRVLIEQLTSTFGVAIRAIGKIKKINTLTSIVCFSELLLLILVFSFGCSPTFFVIIGVLSATTNRIIVVNYTIKNCNLSLKKFIQDLFFKVFIIFIGTLLLSCIPTCFLNESFMRLIITVLLSTITFSILSYYIGLNKSEKLFIKDLTHKFILKKTRTNE